MKIKCPKCNCEYEPNAWESSDCPLCGYGMWANISTGTTSQDDSINKLKK